MKLTVIGSAPAWTRRPGVASSCYLIEHEGAAIVLDMGQGAFAALAGQRDPATIDGVVISHLHADHLVDLVPLRHYLKFEAVRPRSVALHGPVELRQRVDRLLAEEGFLDQLEGDALAVAAFQVGPFRIQPGRVTHIPDSFAFRVSVAGDGPALVYSGDCGVADDLVPLIEPGDVLLCEAAFGTDEPAGSIHLSADQAASLAERTRAGKLVLTHILDRSDAQASGRLAAARYSGSVLLARPGLEVEVG